ncbi:MAG: tRNA (adenosine(37)-N6)-threonylcarbamoyltransferase complex transferase subunit TsaD [Lachnospiraceae bacterium]|nr:tRNA (adenosine(37)-N6)-threonylcarbamoyltransferase complex transferase subunit TsaD [Lachnospiraceae bacterium]
MSNIKILAIESSCDETAAAVIANGREIRSNIINSQIDLHTKYGGVVPELASRKHIENINPVVREALSQAGETFDSIDAVAVTYGPGLVGALLVGVSAAKAIAFAKNKPLIGVNHIEGHVCASLLEHPDLEPPFLCLIVSGGHTNLAVMEDYGKFRILGSTRDDAAGEAFDKVARAIGLGYPGGPKIEAAAKSGDPEAIHFPRGKVDEAPFDFTFSGMKSAVLNYLNQEKMAGREVNTADVAAGFQQAVTDVLTGRAIEAAKQLGEDRIVMAGGVAANGFLRESLERECGRAGIKLYVPSKLLCTDNAAMIGAAAYYHYIRGERADLTLNAVPGLGL